MRSIITGCSGIIVVNLAIRYKKIENQWRQEVIPIIKHEIGDFNALTWKISKIPSLENKGAEWAR